jgi:hypothetical protein
VVGFAAYARAGLCAALLAGGCLAAPPSGTGGGGGGGDPGCIAFLEDTFDDPDGSETLFAIDQDPPDASVSIGGGTASLEARGSTVVGLASLRSWELFDVANTALEISVDVTINQNAVVILSLDTDDQAGYDLRGHVDHLAVSHDDPDTGDAQDDCDPCGDFGDGSWTMRIEERQGRLHFLAGPSGDTPSDLLPEGLEGDGQPVHAQVWLLAPESTDTVLANVDSLTWSICDE